MENKKNSRLLFAIGVVFLVTYLVMMFKCLFFDECLLFIPTIIINLIWIIGLIFICTGLFVSKDFIKLLKFVFVSIIALYLYEAIQNAIDKVYLFETIRTGVIISSVILLYIISKIEDARKN